MFQDLDVTTDKRVTFTASCGRTREDVGEVGWEGEKTWRLCAEDCLQLNLYPTNKICACVQLPVKFSPA